MHYTNDDDINKDHMSYIMHNACTLMIESVVVTDERGYEMVQVGIVIAEKHTFGSQKRLTYFE